MAPDSKPAKFPFPTCENVPEEFLPLKRWLGWKSVWDPKGGKDHQGKWKKPPHSPVDGSAIGATKKYLEHFVTFAEALEGANKHQLDGVGFVFAEGDGYVGIDFDDCVKDSTLDQDVLLWLRWFGGAWAESSPSGNGLHVLCKGQLPRAITARVLKNSDGATIEAYSQGRYFTVTGQPYDAVPPAVGNCQDGINKLLEEYGSSAPEEVTGSKPLSRFAARQIYASLLDKLRNARHGEGNAKLNEAAFFAGRAFASGVLSGTDESIKDTLLKIVTVEWSHPHPEQGARSTIDSGWGSGVNQPLELTSDSKLEEMIEEFNEKYYVFRNFGGRCVVAWEEENSASRRKELKFQTIHDFENFYRNERIIVGQRRTPKGEEDIIKTKAVAWLDHPQRRSFDRVEFKPNHKLPDDVYNFWQGFAYESKKGNCSLYLKHLEENVCDGKEEYEWLLNWMAYAVQHPDEPGYTAPVLRGEKGTGKNVAAEGFANLWGNHRAIYINADHVTGRFNGGLRDCSVVIMDECFYAGNRQHEQTLKTLITGDIIPVEKKFVQTEQVRNYLHIIILSNSEWVIRASDDERRYTVFEVKDTHRQDHPYFAAIKTQLNHGGYEALLYELLHRNLMGFDPRKALRNQGLRDQMTESLTGIDSLWFECLQRGALPGEVQKDKTVLLSSTELITWAKSQHERDWDSLNFSRIANFFKIQEKRGKKRSMEFPQERPFTPEGKVRRWVIPPLDIARKRWNEKRYEVLWDEANEWRTVLL